MRLQIPTIGTVLILEKQWTFRIHKEFRNESILKAFGVPTEGMALWGNNMGVCMGLITLPTGTQLKVSRIYIRNGAKEFDSITFDLVDLPDDRPGPVMMIVNPKETRDLVSGVKLKKIRFWAKLMDVNEIECEIDQETMAKI